MGLTFLFLSMKRRKMVRLLMFLSNFSNKDNLSESESLKLIDSNLTKIKKNFRKNCSRYTLN